MYFILTGHTENNMSKIRGTAGAGSKEHPSGKPRWQQALLLPTLGSVRCLFASCPHLLPQRPSLPRLPPRASLPQLTAARGPRRKLWCPNQSGCPEWRSASQPLPQGQPIFANTFLTLHVNGASPAQTAGHQVRPAKRPG